VKIIKKPESITNQQADKIKKRLDHPDKMFLQLAIESGLRISDLLKLKVGEIQKTMTVYESKSKRDRTFKISDELYRELKNFVRYRRKASLVFQSARKATKSVHRTTIHRHIKQAVKGLKFNASAHSLRKLYAHNVFSDTHDITKVQESLHHKNIETTCAYLDIDIKNLIMSQKGDT
jgi:integrase